MANSRQIEETFDTSESVDSVNSAFRSRFLNERSRGTLMDRDIRHLIRCAERAEDPDGIVGCSGFAKRERMINEHEQF